MLKLTGLLIGLYKTNSFTKEDGSVVQPKTKCQVMVQVPLKDGTKKSELLDISIPEHKASGIRDKINKEITLDVAAIAANKRVIYYGI